MNDTKTLKVYIRGTIGRGRDIANMFSEMGVSNPMNYGFNDPNSIYYPDMNNNVAMTQVDTELYYVMSNSDWVELNVKPLKRVRQFIVKLREGSSKCDGCEYRTNCGPNRRDKCSLAKQIWTIVNGAELSGKELEVTEVDEVMTPVTMEPVWPTQCG